MAWFLHLLGSQITASSVGRVVREVRCENCGCEYVYVVRAKAVGGSFNVFHLDEEGAVDRARRNADSEVQQKLRGAYMAVACPDCGWFQEYMLEILRRRRLRRWMILASLPLVWIFCKWCFTSAETPAELGLIFWTCVSIGIAIVGFVIHVIWFDNRNPDAQIVRDPRRRRRAIRKSEFINARVPDEDDE